MAAQLIWSAKPESLAVKPALNGYPGCAQVVAWRTLYSFCHLAGEVSGPAALRGACQSRDFDTPFGCQCSTVAGYCPPPLVSHARCCRSNYRVQHDVRGVRHRCAVVASGLHSGDGPGMAACDCLHNGGCADGSRADGSDDRSKYYRSMDGPDSCGGRRADNQTTNRWQMPC